MSCCLAQLLCPVPSHHGPGSLRTTAQDARALFWIRCTSAPRPNCISEGFRTTTSASTTVFFLASVGGDRGVFTIAVQSSPPRSLLISSHHVTRPSVHHDHHLHHHHHHRQVRFTRGNCKWLRISRSLGIGVPHVEQHRLSLDTARAYTQRTPGTYTPVDVLANLLILPWKSPPPPCACVWPQFVHHPPPWQLRSHTPKLQIS